jgi:hypothetical protein
MSRLAVRLTVALVAVAAACTAVVSALFVETLRRYGLFETEIPVSVPSSDKARR